MVIDFSSQAFWYLLYEGSILGFQVEIGTDWGLKFIFGFNMV